MTMYIHTHPLFLKQVRIMDSMQKLAFKWFSEQIEHITRRNNNESYVPCTLRIIITAVSEKWTS